MKKLFFSFVMLVTLVIVAGSAFAANETNVLPGGTYTYTLKGVSSVNKATAVVDYTGANETIAEIGNSFTINAGDVDKTVSFTIKYGSQTSLPTDGDIVVTITDGTSTCANSIKLHITIEPIPTINLAMNATEDQYCQTTKNTNDNTAASLNSANALTFTISKTVDHAPATYTWGYTITLPNSTNPLNSFVVKRNGVETAPGTFTNIPSDQTDIWTVEFNTTTNLSAQSITATLSVVKLTDTTSAAGVYDETVTNDNSDVVSVKSMPAIGKFE